jgi:hypothetical protein
MRRWLAAIGVLSALVVSNGVTAFCVAWSDEFKTPKTALLRDLHGSRLETNAEFRRRLLERAPLGSPEPLLLATLKAEGFSRGWEPAPATARTADIRWSNFACNMGAPVSWRVDQADRVVALTTDYGWYGCL